MSKLSVFGVICLYEVDYWLEIRQQLSSRIDAANCVLVVPNCHCYVRPSSIVIVCREKALDYGRFSRIGYNDLLELSSQGSVFQVYCDDGPRRVAKHGCHLSERTRKDEAPTGALTRCLWWKESWRNMILIVMYLERVSSYISGSSLYDYCTFISADECCLKYCE